MFASERIIRALIALSTDEVLVYRGKEHFEEVVAPVVRELESDLDVTDARMRASIRSAPTAALVADTLDGLDREARRAAAGLERGIAPDRLRGRGTRLSPRRQGLVVAGTTPGSLDIQLLLGGLYTTVTSQPLSFALNLASLMQYGKIGIDGFFGKGRQTVELPVPLSRSSQETRVSTPYVNVVAPRGVSVQLEFEQSDGSRLLLTTKSESPQEAETIDS